MKSVLLPFHTGMYLEDHKRKDQDTILKAVTAYLLGCKKFSATKALMADYGVSADFQKVLRSMTPEYHRLYRKTIRRYVKGKDDARVSNFDEYYLDRIGISPKKVQLIKYPSEDDVIKSMSFTINAKAYRLKVNRKLLRMTQYGIDDLKQSMYLRVLQAYRTYLPSLGRCLPIRAFYKVLHCALSSSIVDSLRNLDTSKSQLTVPFAQLGVEFENSIDVASFASGFYHNPPEEDYQAKESLYLKMPYFERKKYADVFA